LCAVLQQVTGIAWVQLPGASNNLFQDKWCACSEINFSDTQQRSTFVLYNL